MKDTLTRKNIESLIIDLLIISVTFFLVKIEISTLAFMLLVILTISILIITKKPPKNFFPIIIYVFSILFLVFGIILLQKNIYIEEINLLETFNPQSIATLAFTLLIFILVLINYPKRNNTYRTIQTFFLPILYSLVFLSVENISNNFSMGVGIILLIYLPIRLLVAYTEYVKWYQFILILVSLITILNSAKSQKNTPFSPIYSGLKTLNTEFVCKEFKTDGNDIIVEIKFEKEDFTNNIPKGKYYIAVSNIWENSWRIDKQKTIDYYKNEKNYFYDSAIIAKLFLNIDISLQIFTTEKNNFDGLLNSSEIQNAENYCDSARINIRDNNLQNALKNLTEAQKSCYAINDIYLLKAKIFILQNKETDSICFYISKALEYNNTEALDLYRKYCVK